ncbi:30S ribosomal protein S21 [Tenacibaculum sp. IB213877]|uniref:30S ribosomal protein S21 n=1 Tax=Tenacibaculum sp. IB213877 TaxID=3097351 RepID=UPI002A5A410D|nr:30S ribosomal protein S21 [Tenacibaculum sp. IB213877]MDY0779851.1 30S ribosomal protein S21 [Tenacibaculum sp. IB213877]
MLIVQVKEGENIDRAIKRYRRKYRDTKLLKEIRNRKEYTKPSVARREQLKKAQYKEQYLLEQEK